VRLAGAASAPEHVEALYQFMRLDERTARRLAPARALLGPAGAAAAWDEGRAMTLAEAIAYGLSDEE
jgi:hypothetical protein